MIQEFIKKVGEFHNAFGVKRGNVDVELRYKLFKEEYEEYLEGCEAEKKGLKYFTTKKGEYVNTFIYKVDAIIDMLYIACGTLDVYDVSFGKELIRDEFSSYDEDDCLDNISRHLEKYLQSGIFWHNHHLIINVLDLAKRNHIYDKLFELFQEVHESNMSKLDENGEPIINDGIIDPTKPVGKILKGKNFFEPNLEKILKNYE